jgi:hypothetical protein
VSTKIFFLRIRNIKRATNKEINKKVFTRITNNKKNNIINIHKIKKTVIDFAKKTILKKVSIKVINGLKLFM